MTFPRFAHVYCSQCGAEFGAGDYGYSHCEDHGGQPPDAKALLEQDLDWLCYLGKQLISAPGISEALRTRIIELVAALEEKHANADPR